MNNKTLLASIAIASGLTAAASADQVSTSELFSGFAGSSYNFTTLDKFDTSLGTLTGVNIQLSVNSTGALAQADNEDAAPTGSIDISYLIGGNLTGVQSVIDAALSNAWSNIDINDSASATLGIDDGDGIGLQVGGPDYFDFAPAAGADIVNANLHAITFADYEGTAGQKLDLTYGSTSLVTTTAVGAVSTASSPANVSGSVLVTYTYTAAVPEPSSTALLGLGGLALILRRRK